MVFNFSPASSISLNQSGLPEALRVMTDYFRAHVEKDTGIVIPGVVDLLDSLTQSNVEIGLVTGNCEGIAREKMKFFGLDNWLGERCRGGFGSDHR